MDSSILRGGLAIVALSWATACSAETLSPAGRPELKIGDSSVVRNLDVRTGEKRDTSIVVIMVDADKIVNETSGSTSGTRTYTRDYNLLEVKTGEKVTLTVKPFWAYLRFPLEVGTFQAFKIEYDGRYFAHQGNQSWTGSHKETAWYAPAINHFVKRELEQRAPGRNFLNQHVIELLSFKPAS